MPDPVRVYICIYNWLSDCYCNILGAVHGPEHVRNSFIPWSLVKSLDHAARIKHAAQSKRSTTHLKTGIGLSNITWGSCYQVLIMCDGMQF
jgi:hypothetical protein